MSISSENNFPAKTDALCKKAEAGDAQAQYQMGQLYLSGKFTPLGYMPDVQNYPGDPDTIPNYICEADADAFKWFKKAAEQGHLAAQAMLAECYLLGRGAEKDDQTFIKWCRLAAERGHVSAQLNLGYYYFEEPARNITEAIRWFRKAADQSHSAGYYYLAKCHRDKRGKYPSQAVEFLRKAAELGCVLAQKDLGVCYATGEGVERNNVEAYAWLSVGNLSELSDDDEKLMELTPRMAADELWAGMALAEQYITEFRCCYD